MSSLGITGHRPNKLWGYNYHNWHYSNMLRYFQDYIINEKITDVYCGMALGVDIIMALAVCELKDSGFSVRLHACIPCYKQDAKWNEEDRKLYLNILEQADSIIGVDTCGNRNKLTLIRVNDYDYKLIRSDGSIYNQEYKPYLMNERNKVIVDSSDTLLAVWDGSDGGTANCINYARSIGRINILVKCPGEF